MRRALVHMALLALVALTAAAVAAAGITLMADGKAVKSDPPPLLQDGHVYVPLRAAAEAVGGEVHYDAATKRVTVCRGATCALIRQSDGITVNGRLLVGIRQVGEALNARVDWDGAGQAVIINTSSG